MLQSLKGKPKEEMDVAKVALIISLLAEMKKEYDQFQAPSSDQEKVENEGRKKNTRSRRKNALQGMQQRETEEKKKKPTTPRKNPSSETGKKSGKEKQTTGKESTSAKQPKP